jgi:replicative DNA helicase
VIQASNEYDIKMIVVDHLGIVKNTPEVARLIREQQVAYTSRSMKTLAKEMNCSVFELVHLGREFEKNQSTDQKENSSPEPKLSDIRESGSIENDADNVLML